MDTSALLMCDFCTWEDFSGIRHRPVLTFADDATLHKHIEDEHHLIVPREDESALEAEARYWRTYPARECCRPTS